ncbi:conserved hypothetical protein [Uncinocarpus reesii 1704]|uniref:Tyrosine-protein phosphatase SIW14 n=1 Tax=Uncinocarpus reesii (strain UAMH 1704) TaxID=336963 RepID=C4JSY4_UNCRE|nr:uncharacterized protein UREG_05573 [Uncinocarpus reesii 1704]EEP80731.1 conserved hypothetical protein [Uncinocarpus reesii 1704]
MVDDLLDSPVADTPQLLSPGYDGVGQIVNGKKKYISSGFESGPSRPPTPHGPGLPPNFAEVVKGIYRSSFPLPDHFESIKKLNLKTILTLVDFEHSRQFRKFIKDNGIVSHVIPIIANKDPKIFTPQNTVLDVLKILFNPKNHPILVHCNKGKVFSSNAEDSRGWSNAAAVAEYIKYSTPKSRVLDRKFIEAFDANILCELVDRVGAQYWTPSSPPERQPLQGEPTNYINGHSKEAKEGKDIDGTPGILASDTKQLCDMDMS